MTGEEPIDIALHPMLLEPFKEWLAGRGLRLAGPIHSIIGEQDLGDDHKFYVVAPED